MLDNRLLKKLVTTLVISVQLYIIGDVFESFAIVYELIENDLGHFH